MGGCRENLRMERTAHPSSSVPLGTLDVSATSTLCRCLVYESSETWLCPVFSHQRINSTSARLSERLGSSLCFLALRVLVSPLGHPGQPRLPFCRWVGKCFRQSGGVKVSLTLPTYLQRLAVRLNIHYLF